MLKHCVVNFMKNSFFDEENCLKCKKIYSIKKEYIYDVKESLNEILEKIAYEEYQMETEIRYKNLISEQTKFLKGLQE